jgi:hypothetical protein
MTIPKLELTPKSDLTGGENKKQLFFAIVHHIFIIIQCNM